MSRLNQTQSNNSGSVWQISCHNGWKLNQPASGKPICSAVYFAYSWRIGSGVPAAIAISWAWHERSMVMNQNAASSTVSPTVNNPWFLWIAALPVGNFDGQLPARLDLEHDRAALLGDHDVVLVEDAGVLCQRGERDAERAERLAVRRVRVRGGDDVGPGLVDRGVDHERRPVDRVLAVHDVAGVVHEDQVAGPRRDGS